MRKFIVSLILVVVAAMPTLNAQQASPSQNTTMQQPSKPKAAPNRAFPQPKVQPTQPTTANNNPGQKKGVANNPEYGKPAGNNTGNGKTTDNNVRPGKTTGNDTGHGKTTNDNRGDYADAMRRYRHERHDHDWWKQHYIVIVLVGGGYYYHDSGYWYPAWGYDPNYERYDYDGPIYTYGNLLPDQVIINVQRALKELGYYAGDLNGSLGVNTRNALAAYQQDYGLDATGVVDEATVRALGLI
jgi:Putative peptidoglycan-binding domain-containing protein